MIVELLAIVSLKTRDGTMELSLNKRMKRNKCGKKVGLVPQWKGQDIVSEVIKNNKIIRKPRIAHNITMQQSKWKSSNFIQFRKRKSNTFAKTTGMARVIVFGTMKIKRLENLIKMTVTGVPKSCLPQITGQLRKEDGVADIGAGVLAQRIKIACGITSE
jgi:hypothetical protein